MKSRVKNLLLSLVPIFLFGSLLSISTPVQASPLSNVLVQVKKASEKFKKGAKSTDKETFKKFPKHVVRKSTPTTYMILPSSLNMLGNDQYGDCVTAEEGFNKQCDGINISYQTAVTWAGNNGYLNGADLPSVLNSMATSGFQQDSNTYNDGPYTSVNYNDWATLTNAISIGRVKIGVASSQFDNVPNVGVSNGWIMTGFQQDTSEDHCVSLCGFGTMTQLCSYFNITPPANASTYTQCLALYTWSTVGIIDFQSMQNITAEAYLRNPSTITVGSGTPSPDSVTVFPVNPNPPVPPTPIPPTPTPPVPPTPTPTPTPNPNGYTGSVTYTYSNGILTNITTSTDPNPAPSLSGPLSTVLKHIVTRTGRMTDVSWNNLVKENTRSDGTVNWTGVLQFLQTLMADLPQILADIQALINLFGGGGQVGTSLHEGASTTTFSIPSSLASSGCSSTSTSQRNGLISRIRSNRQSTTSGSCSSTTNATQDTTGCSSAATSMSSSSCGSSGTGTTSRRIGLLARFRNR